jgi:hypothetical protein
MTVGSPEEAFQASIDLDIPGNSRSFFFLQILCALEASIVASTELTLLLLLYVLIPKLRIP